MTVIAWDGKTLAGDRLRALNGTLSRARKVFRITGKDGRANKLTPACGGGVDCVSFK